MRYPAVCLLFCLAMLYSCDHNPKVPPNLLEGKEPAQAGKGNGPIFFEETDFNFRYEIPSGNWVVIDPRKANPRASFAMRHPDGMAFLILAHKKRVEDKDLTASVFADAIRKELTRIYKNTGAQVNKGNPIDIDGRTGMHYSVYTAKREFFHVCAFIYEGTIYQLIYDGKDQDLEATIETFFQLISNFSLIEHVL